MVPDCAKNDRRFQPNSAAEEDVEQARLEAIKCCSTIGRRSGLDRRAADDFYNEVHKTAPDVINYPNKFGM